MVDARKGIIASIRAELGDLPEESIRGALEFYEEYVADALEAGQPEEETLERLGGLKEIAAQVRAEAAIAGAERSPGPVRLIGASRQALRGLAGFAARFSLFLGASIPYTLALGLYLVAVAAFISAPASAAFLGYGITTIPRADLMTEISMASAALLSAAFLAAAGLGLWAAADGIARVTLRALRRGLRRDRLVDGPAGGAPPRKGRLKAAFLICAIAGMAGIGGIFLSRLPTDLFSIWNSEKPGNLNVLTWNYPAAGIREIEVSTMNSEIVLEPAADSRDGIHVVYEEPPWLKGTPEVRGGKLSFKEASSGMLPFMDFIARHPGTTSVRITFPRGYRARAVTLESGSGAVSLAASADTVRVATDSGDIRFTPGRTVYRIQVSAPKGGIIVKGRERKGGAYVTGPAGGNLAELTTVDGTVEVR